MCIFVYLCLFVHSTRAHHHKSRQTTLCRSDAMPCHSMKKCRIFKCFPSLDMYAIQISTVNTPDRYFTEKSEKSEEKTK